MQIAGCSAVVTGGASGLGRATVQRLHRAEASVVVLDLPSSRGAELAREAGDGIRFVAGDVTEPADVAAAVAAAADLAPLRIAVAAAGIGPPARLFDAAGVVAADRIRATLDVNVLGTLLLLAHAGHAMAQNPLIGEERGVMICTASIAAFDGQVGQIAYAASKGAIVGATLPAAREFARHAVRVMTIAPGLFDTPLFAGMPEDARRSVEQQVPHPSRLGRPDEYAAMVEHIVRNPMLNGDVVRLDAAMRMGPR